MLVVILGFFTLLPPSGGVRIEALRLVTVIFLGGILKDFAVVRWRVDIEVGILECMIGFLLQHE